MMTAQTTARLQTLAPQFLVTDLHRARAFYREKLGFDTAFIYGDFYAGVQRDGLTIHLKLWDHPDPSRALKLQHEHLDAYISTDHIEDLYREYQDRKVPFLKPIHTTEWGTKEFALQDPDGYILYFGQQA